MSSTEPSGEHTPARLHFPGTGHRVGHRLSAGIILLVIAVIIVIAAAVTAAIVLPGSTSHPKPPAAPPGKLAAMTAESLPGTTTPDTVAPVMVARSPAVVFSTAGVVLATADAVPLPHGLSVTPAPGWTVHSTQPNGVWLCNSDCTETLWVGIGHYTLTDVVAVLQAQINDQTGGPTSGYTNVQTGQIQTETLQSNNFQQHAYVGYNANVSTQQGTVAVEGIFSTLLNTSTGVTAFLNMEASGDSAFNEAKGANRTMAASMV
jgi:hypothetical protein